MKIIIVTISYNDKENLLRTFNSIRKYKKSFQSYFVIDGGSTDGSNDTILDNSDIIDDYLIEKDQGIYDAMNKVDRFNLTIDDFIIWINSGDELLDWEGIDLDKLTTFDCAFFAVVAKMNIISAGKIIYPQIFLPFNEKHFYPKTRYMHQGFIVRYSLFNKYKYDLSIGIQAENLLMANCITENSFFISDRPLTIFYNDGISNTKHWQVLCSYLKVAKKLKFSLIKLVYYKYNFIFKLLIKSIIAIYLTRLIQNRK